MIMTIIFVTVTILLSLGVLGGFFSLVSGQQESNFANILAFVLLSFVVVVLWTIVITGQFIL